MRITRATLAALLIAALPGVIWGQASTAGSRIIPCEGPDMPAQCPRDTATPSGDAARTDMAVQEAAMLEQQQALTSRRREILDQLYRSQQRALPPSTLPQLNPYLTLPDFRAAARVVDGIVTGTGP